MTPGWLFRAALASCLATRIAMEAAGTDVMLYRARSMIHGFLHMTALRGPRDEVMKIAGG